MMENSIGIALKKQTKKRWREEEKQKHYEQWKASGLSQNAYCGEQGLSTKTFNQWVRIREKKPLPSFSLVPVKKAMAVKKEAMWVEVKWNEGLSCRFQEGVNLKWMMEVIGGLHHVACDIQ